MTIQSWIDDVAERGGGRVHLEAGFYHVNGLDLPFGVHLEGEGRNTVLRLNAGANRSVIKVLPSADGITKGNAGFCAVRNLCIDGNKTAQLGVSHGIEVTTNPRYTQSPLDDDFDMLHTFESLYIKDVKTDGYHDEGRSGTKLIGVVVYRADRYGFQPSFDTDLVACISGHSGYAGFNIVNSSVRISGCKSFYSGRVPYNYEGYGFWIRGTNGVVLAACEAQDNKGSGFVIDNSKGIVVQGVADSNSRAGAGEAAGVTLWESAYCLVNAACYERFDDKVHSWQPHALKLHNATHNTISLSHFGIGGAVMQSALTSDSDPVGNNHVMINAALIP